jgi:U32 family peptidase
LKSMELLAPAGNLEKLEVALAYGADAVYFSGKKFGLRAFADNFGDEELRAGVDMAHRAGKKAFITVNIFPHNCDLEGLPDHLRLIRDCGADAAIISDLGVWRLAREVTPGLPLHISTQANNTNWASVLTWQDLGAGRVVLARELSLEDIRTIRSKTSLELEVFAHGAMCVSYSGRCLLSNYFTSRDANRGECAQPCRWKYHLMEETRPGEYYPVAEDEQGSYFFNSKDLCLLPFIPSLAESGVDSIKIEGRMKSNHYVATVVKVYREALDACAASPAEYAVRPAWVEELAKVSHRPYCSGFTFPDESACEQIYGSSTYRQSHEFIGMVKEYDPASGLAVVEQRNNMRLGDEIEILQPGGENFRQTITSMTDAAGNSITVAPHAQQIIAMPLAKAAAPLAMLRRKAVQHV